MNEKSEPQDNQTLKFLHQVLDEASFSDGTRTNVDETVANMGESAEEENQGKRDTKECDETLQVLQEVCLIDKNFLRTKSTTSEDEGKKNPMIGGLSDSSEEWRDGQCIPGCKLQTYETTCADQKLSTSRTSQNDSEASPVVVTSHGGGEAGNVATIPGVFAMNTGEARQRNSLSLDLMDDEPDERNQFDDAEDPPEDSHQLSGQDVALDDAYLVIEDGTECSSRPEGSLMESFSQFSTFSTLDEGLEVVDGKLIVKTPAQSRRCGQVSKVLLLILLVIVLALVVLAAALLLPSLGDDEEWQRFHMVSFFYMSNGQAWFRNDHWLSYNVSECEWFNHGTSANVYGLESLEALPVCNEDNELLVFNMSANNLNGHFQLITHWVPTMRRFDISKNNLQGLIPVMSHQPEVEVYDVSENQFNGMMVGEFSSFKMKVTRTHGNRLFGRAPGMYHFLPYLEDLDNSGNLYQNPLATEIGHCQDLKTLNNANNMFYGALPSELGSLSLLKNYNVSGNIDVNGSIPNTLKAPSKYLLTAAS
ncbi:Leucine rich repeat N-terminal domain [Seminavis robusta]|uniref:Leucine rich repeat N-terminal domain n=1 Tax=Seminavis robusta TaxID=568900 RepID=A0A9N8EEI5_9STRA|nr:Leucine rich repeat N-terminal domain [Seminavis robusta]|eukprot:Sro820_g207300.1 Leucine rich repeat N-terminal domain (534) ;mRNA; f:38738-40613